MKLYQIIIKSLILIHLPYLVLIKMEKKELVIKAYNLNYNYGTNKNYKVKLINEKGNPCKNFKVRIYFKSKYYTLTTNNNGNAFLKLKLNPGIYQINIKFLGDKNYNPCNITRTITTNGTYVYATCPRLTPKKYYNYQVKIKDLNKLPIVGEYVSITLGSKKVKVKTNNQGLATFKIKVPKKSMKFYLTYSGKTSPLTTIKRYIYTFKNMPNQNSIWVRGEDMYNINLNTLKKSNVKNIFLHTYALDVFGKNKVKNFIAKSNKYGIKVHLWMQCFYNGDWINPLTCGQKYLNKIISRAKSYAKIPGLAGIHFDYLRFGGNAYEYKGATEKISSFTRDITNAIVEVNGGLILSAAIMPEKEDIYYYGQDPNTLGKYLDVLVPMVYIGNYHQTYKWIGTMTKYFKANSDTAKVCIGLQTYKSDSNPVPVSVTKLAKQVNAAYDNGGDGIALFRLGLTNFYKIRTK